MKQRKISRFITEGDSLSDRGTLNKRRILGLIPMSWVSGLNTESPQGRFTNGLTWDDHVSAMFANVFLMNEFKIPAAENPSIAIEALDLAGGKARTSQRRCFNNADIADALINGDEKINKTVRDAYSLKDDRRVDYQGKNLFRNYNEGGLTAFDYSWVINSITSWTMSSFKYFCTCLILATLSSKRSQLLDDDKKANPTNKHKAETLVIEWSGANDFILANAKPSHDVAIKAVKARVDNFKELIKNGYQNFVWFNLPNIALTPRYQAKSTAERELAERCTKDFNDELEKAYAELALNYPQCTIEIFNVNKIFSEIYDKPEDYGLSREKRTQAYTKSEEFLNSTGTSPAKGYMFWDDVHPSADMHALLALKFYQKFNMKYAYTAPQDDAPEERIQVSEDQLLAAYRNLHGQKVRKERAKFFHGIRPIHTANVALEDIIASALHGGDKLALSVLKELQWVDNKGELKLNSPVLERKLNKVQIRHQVAPTVHTTDKSSLLAH